jgi:hypothetical protein
MESNATEGITGKITLEIGGGTTDEDMQTEPVQSFTILAGQTAELSFDIKDISTRIEEPYIQSIYIRAKIWYKDINAADTSARYIYFDFLKGEQTAEVQLPVSIKAINDSMGW